MSAITSYQSTHLAGESNKTEASTPLGVAINHDNGINNLAKLFKEAEELFIVYYIRFVHVLCVKLLSTRMRMNGYY
jgi:hypothetical protein